MKNIFSVRFWILVCQVLLIGCSESRENLPIDFEEDYQNQQILLRAPDYLNTFSTKDAIYLELKYNSNNEIILPNDYNLRIFKRTTDGWVEISEIPTQRLPSEDIVFSPNKEMPPVEAIFVGPDLGNYTQNFQLLIYVFGEMKTEKGNQKVAAYVNVELHP